LKPIFEEVACKLKGKVNFGAVDMTVEKKVGGKFDVKGFPTIKVSQYLVDKSCDGLLTHPCLHTGFRSWGIRGCGV
jgi:hypothetical protein